jgi:glycosyltransferase involved in cell wall biosynthesis
MKFSVLLPTRNRLDLLSYAVETVMRQDYDDWEIIISDNYSDEDIGAYVAGLGDSRIHYSRTDQFVSVTENWNNTLNRASGDYVIMLGDDDGLMPGFFTTLAGLIGKYEQPDLIYTDAYVYSYPGVLPEFPSGALRNGYNNYFQVREPFLLDRAIALAIVGEALELRFPIMYNMQLSVIHKDLIESLSSYGDFFQSPFPDFYATIASFLKSKRTLIYQQPIVTIGVSKKSYGFHLFNNREGQGKELLNTLREQEATRLQAILLPGSWTLNCQLIAMETVQANYKEDLQPHNLKLDYGRYRRLQFRSNYRNYYHEKLVTRDFFIQALETMQISERILYGLVYGIPFAILSTLGKKRADTLVNFDNLPTNL